MQNPPPTKVTVLISGNGSNLQAYATVSYVKFACFVSCLGINKTCLALSSEEWNYRNSDLC